MFKHVALRAPRVKPVHMHMRYGVANSSFEGLLAISRESLEDKTKLDPWLSVYCAEGGSGCDKEGLNSGAVLVEQGVLPTPSRA